MFEYVFGFIVGAVTMYICFKFQLQPVTLIIPVEDIKLLTKPMKSTVRSRKQKWTSYKRVSLKEVRKCLSTYSDSL